MLQYKQQHPNDGKIQWVQTIAIWNFLLSTPKPVALTQFGSTGKTRNLKQFSNGIKKFKMSYFDIWALNVKNTVIGPLKCYLFYCSFWYMIWYMNSFNFIVVYDLVYDW